MTAPVEVMSTRGLRRLPDIPARPFYPGTVLVYAPTLDTVSREPITAPVLTAWRAREGWWLVPSWEAQSVPIPHPAKRWRHPEDLAPVGEFLPDLGPIAGLDVVRAWAASRRCHCQGDDALTLCSRCHLLELTEATADAVRKARTDEP